MWELWIKFYLDQNKDYRQKDNISDSSGKLLWKVRICVILVKVEYMHSSMYFVFCFLFLFFVFFFCRRFLLVTVNDISAFLDMRRYKNYKTGSRKHLTMWRPVCLFFSEHRVLHSWSRLWTPFRGYWTSAAAAARDLIFVDRWKVPIYSWQDGTQLFSAFYTPGSQKS